MARLDLARLRLTACDDPRRRIASAGSLRRRVAPSCGRRTGAAGDLATELVPRPVGARHRPLVGRPGLDRRTRPGRPWRRPSRSAPCPSWRRGWASSVTAAALVGARLGLEVLGRLRLADRRLRAAGHPPRLRADGGLLLVGLPPVGHREPGRRRRRPRALDRSGLGAGHLDLGVGGRHRRGDRRVRAPPAHQVEHRRHRPLHRRPWRADRLPHRRRRRGAARRGAHVPGRRDAGPRLGRAGVAGRRRPGPVLRRRPRRPRPRLGEHRAAPRARRGGRRSSAGRPTCCAASARP